MKCGFFEIPFFSDPLPTSSLPAYVSNSVSGGTFFDGGAISFDGRELYYDHSTLLFLYAVCQNIFCKELVRKEAQGHPHILSANDFGDGQRNAAAFFYANHRLMDFGDAAAPRSRIVNCGLDGFPFLGKPKNLTLVSMNWKDAIEKNKNPVSRKCGDIFNL